MLIFDKHIEMAMELPERDRNRLLGLIVAYAYTSEEPSPEALAAMPAWLRALWVGVKADVDTFRERSENGRRGGRPKTTEVSGSQADGCEDGYEQPETTLKTSDKPNRNQAKTTLKTSDKPSPNKSKDKGKDINPSPQTRACAGAEAARPPEDDPGPSHAVEEVRASFFSQGFGADNPQAEAFFDHYAAQGWVLGNGQPVRDLNAAVRRWMRDKPAWDAKAQAAPQRATSAIDFSGVQQADDWLAENGFMGEVGVDGDQGAS